MEQIKIND